MSEVFELPFTMTNAEATSRAAWEFTQTYAQHEFKDVKVLAVHVHGPGYLFTTKKQMKYDGRLQGHEIPRPDPLTNKMLAAMGATPVGMPVPAVPEALSKGVIEGAVIPYQVVPSIKVNELVKYAAETDPKYNALYTTVFTIAMNKAKYDSLPADLKKVIDNNSGIEFSAMAGSRAGSRRRPRPREDQGLGRHHQRDPGHRTGEVEEGHRRLDDEWAANMTKAGHDGPKLFKAAQDLIKKYTK
jgi:hypothetical protein